MQQQYKENMANNTGNNDHAPEQQNKHQPASTVNHDTRELHDTDPLKEKLKNIFFRNYQYYIERELKYRVTPTKAYKMIELNILKTANEIISTHLLSIENISLPEINCTIYSTVFSSKEIMDDVSTHKQEKGNRKQEKPK